MAIKRLSFEEYDAGCMYHPTRGCVHMTGDDSGKFIASLTDARQAMHAPALDIDFPLVIETVLGTTRVEIKGPRPTNKNLDALLDVLVKTGLMKQEHRPPPGKGKPNRRLELPPLPFAVEVRAVPSSTPGHFHLYLEREMHWLAYEKVLVALRDAEIIGKDFCDMCIRWRTSFLLKPEYKKSDFKLTFEASA